MASLLPLYLREYYKNDPLFADSKIVTSAFNYENNDVINKKNFIKKIKFDSISDNKLEPLANGINNSLLKIAIENSDAIVKGSEELEDDITKYIEKLDVPVLDFQPQDDFSEAYTNFYLNRVL